MVAAALLLAAGYAPPRPEPFQWLRLSATSRSHIDRRVGGRPVRDHDDAERVRFAPPPGHAQVCDAIETIAAKLRPAGCSAEPGDIGSRRTAGQPDRDTVLIDPFMGISDGLLIEVRSEIAPDIATSHGRIGLRRGLAAPLEIR